MEKLQMVILFFLFFRYGIDIGKETFMYDRKEQDLHKFSIRLIASSIIFVTLILLVYNYKTIF